MNFERAGGILLHPTSLSGRYGVGDLGSEAYRFVDFLAKAGMKLWQILPLSPTGYGDSPYAALSAFAGNPLLISPDLLLEEGLLDSADLQAVPDFPATQVAYGAVIMWKTALLHKSFDKFRQQANSELLAALQYFEAENATWLEDFALYMAIKEAHEGAPWNKWDAKLILRDEATLAEWRTKLAEQIAFQKYAQFIFFRQWFKLKEYANAQNIKIIGDIPIFVAFDSADVWANSAIFMLDENKVPTHVAGVPPDYFSAKGQYWGNPLYRWDLLAQDGYSWWIERVKAALRLTDYLRIDHFRGFAAYWEVPVNDEETAINGRWVKSPGSELFQAIKNALGDLPIIAEDLGVITPDVIALRHETGMPGMRVLQFAFGAFETDQTDPYLPHNFDQNTVVYSGTHDNDTTAGWWATASANEKRNLLEYLDRDPATIPAPAEIAGRLVRLAFSSVANFAIVPMQDTLGLGGEARMNQPGTSSGNWRWRLSPDALSTELTERLYKLNVLFARYIPYRAVPLKGQGNI